MRESDSQAKNSPSLVLSLLIVGDEVVEGRVEDVNLPYLREVMEELGLELGIAFYVRDDLESLTRCFELALEVSQLVVAAGGLGPTEDDLTAEALAKALRRKLVRHREAAERIVSLFQRMGRVMPPSNLKQAELVEGAVPIYSSHGTAPGQFLELGEKIVVLLPGVPSELKEMVESEVLPRLNFLLRRGQRKLQVKKVIKVAGRPESEVAATVSRLAAGYPHVKIGYRATPGVIEVNLKSDGELPGRLLEDIRRELGSSIFTEDERSLEEVLGEFLRDQGLTLAVAESCTGGMLGERITRVPGSSYYFLGGVITYTYQAKSEILGVPASLLEERGAVNEEVALSMARGARRLFRSHLALSITGVAGPGTGGERETVGTVVTGVVTPYGEWAFRYQLPPERELVRQAATTITLAALLFHLRDRGEAGAEHVE